mgnify:CR=1 FL=1
MGKNLWGNFGAAGRLVGEWNLGVDQKENWYERCMVALLIRALQMLDWVSEWDVVLKLLILLVEMRAGQVHFQLLHIVSGNTEIYRSGHIR